MIHKLCRTYDEPFRPGDDGSRETDYALGMAHVGRQLVKHANGVPGLETPKHREAATATAVIRNAAKRRARNPDKQRLSPEPRFRARSQRSRSWQ